MVLEYEVSEMKAVPFGQRIIVWAIDHPVEKNSDLITDVVYQ